MIEWTDKHYNFNYKLTEQDVQKGEIKVDPYFVANQWNLGAKDPSGVLFHNLKNMARWGDKNSVEREIKAMHAQVNRLAEITGVVLEESTDITKTVQDGATQGSLIKDRVITHLKNLGISWGTKEELYSIINSLVFPEETTDPWYPDTSGEWEEVSSLEDEDYSVDTLNAYHGQVKCEILLEGERESKHYVKEVLPFQRWGITSFEGVVAIKFI